MLVKKYEDDDGMYEKRITRDAAISSNFGGYSYKPIVAAVLSVLSVSGAAMAADIGTPTLGDDSAYTLERVDSAGENTITNYEYDASTGDLTSTYYQIDLKKKEYGSGDSVKYYGWTKDSEGHNTFSEVDESAADVVVNYSTSNSQIKIEGQQDGADVTGNFTNLSGTTNGSAINNSILGDITGDFTGNTANSSAHNVSGGAISHTEAGNITGNFTGNSVNTDYGGGGAIHYVITNDINGNFIGNNVNTATGGAGGAITSGDTSRKYGDIVGDFIGNYVQGSTTDSAISGGAIQNYGSTMGNITGNFIGNYVDADTGSVFGGAIWNRWWGNIGDIKGDFIGNYITTDNGEALGGAIGIEHRDAKIHSITGDFIGNYAEATNGNALGGAIFSNSFAPDESPVVDAISSITGNFISNYVLSNGGDIAAGGAIYLQNEYTIGSINGNFINNYAISVNSDYAYGGAIYNTGSMGTITGDFAGNHIISAGDGKNFPYLYGGAIYNSGEMTDIIGNFVNNYIESESGNFYANGGAIYNDSSSTINNIKGNFTNNYIEGLESSSAQGGAIYNLGSIENIEGDFTGNSVWGRSANGGAIYNYGSWISTLTGNFTNNSATSELLNACGGAVYNSMGIGVITGDYTGNFVQGEGSAQGGALWNSQNLFITSNFSDNTAQGKYSAFGGAIYNTDALGGEMDYVQGEYKNNQALSENFAVGGAIYNGSEYSGEYAYIGTGDSNSGINGVFDGNKAIAAELQVPYALSINSLSPMSGSVAGDYNPYYGAQVTPHYAAGGAIYNNGVIKNIKGEYKNNFAGVSFNDRNALAEGGALLAKTDTIATEAFTDEYKLNGTINSPEVNSTVEVAAKQANVEPYVDGGGISGMGGVILKMDVKVGDEVKSVYRPAGDLSSNGINTIISMDLSNLPEDSGIEIPSFATEEEFNQYVAESGAVTNLDDFKEAYNKQIMTISANFDSNKAEAAVSGDARGGAISFVSTNDDLAHVTDSNGVSTYATVQPLPSWMLPSDSLIAHKNIIVDGESVAEFNNSMLESGMMFPGSKLGYVNLLPEREYVIENSNFTNNQAVSNNGSAYGGGVSIVSNPGQLNAYAEEEVHLSEEEFIYDVQGIADNYDYIVAPEGEITTKEQAVAYLNALTEKLKDTGAVIDNPQDSILEGYETVQSPKDKFIFKNISFINNSAEAKGENAEAHGGAIYSQSDVTIQADNGESIISGNKTVTNGTEDAEAIYMDKSEFSEEPVVLEFDTVNNGKILLDDKINGREQYKVNLTGDSTGQTVFNNTVNNAHIVTNDGSNTLLTKESHWNGNDLTMNGGNLSFINNTVGIASLNNITVTKDTSFVADVDLANKTMDRFTAENYGEHTGNVNVVGMNLLSDAKDDNTAIYFAQPGLKYNVTNGTGELPDSNQTTVYSPIYKYNVTYDNQNQYNGQGDGGYFLFSRGSTTGGSSSGGGGGNPSDAFNPAVLSTSTSNLAASQAAMNEAFKYVFEHADAFTQLPANERYAKLNSNKYALSTDYNENMGRLTADLHNKGAWVRPYATFENMDLKHGPKVDAITYGTLVGFDTDFHEHKNGWHSVTTGYVGYTGSQLNYSGVDTTMNGGLLGVTQTYYKKNFWTALTLSAGASVGQSRNMYGKEDFTSLLAGIGSKTGYNFEFKDGKFILQPIMFMSYTFVNTFDYRNAAGVKIEADPMHSIQLNPQVRFIANMKNGWQPYASVGMVWNILNETSVTANNVRLPEMSIKPYVEYGVGVQKCFKDKYTGFMQAMVRNGGRNGVALTAGFRWALGEEGKPIEKVETKPVDEMSYEELRNKKKDRMSSLVPQISRYETGTARLGLMHGE